MKSERNVKEEEDEKGRDERRVATESKKEEVQ